MGGNNEGFHSDPMKSPLFECFLRLHQLNFICTRIPQEYQKLIKQQDEPVSKDPEPVKTEADSEDSFLSVDMSSDDNAAMGPTKIIEESDDSEQTIDQQGKINFQI